MRRDPEYGGGGTAGDDGFLGTDHLKPNLTGRSVRGGTVTLIAQAVKVAAQFAAVAILARLLSPGDFGIFAIVMSLLGLLEIFKDLGLSGATVQRTKLTEGQVSSLFWLNTALGTGAAVLLTASAPVLGWMYDEPVLVQLTPVIALSLVMSGLTAQHLALLRRQMRFTALAAIQMGAELASMAAAVAAAAMGAGLWALVLQRLLWAGIVMTAAWSVCGWQPKRPAAWRDVRALVAFGGNATGAMVIGNVSTNLYLMVIGWFWGAAPLGLYGQAQKLVLMPVQNINMPLTTVALPMLSRLAHEPDRYRRAYMMLVERLAMAMAPLAGLIIAGAEPLVLFILGPQWGDAVPILAWMGVSLVFMPVTYTLSWLYMSQDRTREMLRASVVNAVLSLSAFAAALPFGPVAVAAAFALSGGLLRVPILFWLAGRRGPVSARDFGRVMVLPAAAAGVSAAAIWAMGRLPDMAAASQGTTLVISAVAAATAALALYGMLPRGRRALVESLQIPRLFRSGRAEA